MRRALRASRNLQLISPHFISLLYAILLQPSDGFDGIRQPSKTTSDPKCGQQASSATIEPFPSLSSHSASSHHLRAGNPRPRSQDDALSEAPVQGRTVTLVHRSRPCPKARRSSQSGLHEARSGLIARLVLFIFVFVFGHGLVRSPRFCRTALPVFIFVLPITFYRWLVG